MPGQHPPSQRQPQPHVAASRAPEDTLLPPPDGHLTSPQHHSGFKHAAWTQACKELPRTLQESNNTQRWQAAVPLCSHTNPLPATPLPAVPCRDAASGLQHTQRCKHKARARSGCVRCLRQTQSHPHSQRHKRMQTAAREPHLCQGHTKSRVSVVTHKSEST